MSRRLKLAGPVSAPLYQRIHRGVREAIEAGTLRPGDRLPSVADLAKEWKVARLTVLKAFQGLERDGLLTSEVGRGTFVTGGPSSIRSGRATASRGSAGAAATAASAAGEPKPDVARALRRLREGYAKGLAEMMRVARPPGTIDLSGGVPSPDSVPDGMLERLLSRALAEVGDGVDGVRRLYGYGGPAGHLALRRTVAQRLADQGVTIAPDEFVITAGSQAGAALVAAWAREDGRPVLCETPTFTGIPGAFMLLGNTVSSIPWSSGGLDLDALRASSARRPLLYLCPDFQNPTGLTLRTDERLAVAQWAKERDAAVLEDAIFRDLRFEGDAPPLLYGMLPPGRRFLLGSVSKSFMTGLRVGFVAADGPVVESLLATRRLLDLGGAEFVHAMAAQFLADGYDRHVEKMRATYRARRDASIEALEKTMPPGTTWTRPEGGFQLWVTLPDGLSSIELFLRGIERGVAIKPGPSHDVDGRYTSSFRLGYALATPDEIKTGVARLADATKSLSPRGAGAAVAAAV